MTTQPPPEPGWAQALAGDAPAALVARAVRLAAAGWADAQRQRRVLAPLLDAAAEPDLARILAGLEQGAAGGRRLPSPEETREAGAALLACGARVHLPGHPGYPARLLDAWPDLGAPAWLFVRAPAHRLPDGPAAAVVGTRHPSLDGVATARELGRRLAGAGVTVVSGVARGIDQAAHRGALDAGGATVAVLGTGLDVDYPRGDASLRAEIAGAGGLVTELACGTPPRPAQFLARNRIVAGLADLTVVVEGRRRSGALQTARLAAAQGREVWAVPGSVNAPTSRGPLDLVRDGAQVVTRLDDVVEALAALPSAGGRSGGDEPRRDTPALGATGSRVLELLGPVPAAPGALAAAAGLPVPAVLAAVSDLVARGLATATPRGVAARHQPGGVG